MPRTTLDIDKPILDELKELQKREGRPLGQIVTGLLAEALSRRKNGEAREFKWISKPMGAKIDLADKEALNAILYEEEYKQYRR